MPTESGGCRKIAGMRKPRHGDKRAVADPSLAKGGSERDWHARAINIAKSIERIEMPRGLNAKFLAPVP